MFASNPEKKTQKQAQKDRNEMEWHKMDYLIFSAMCMRKRHLFWALKWVSLLERVRSY